MHLPLLSVGLIARQWGRSAVVVAGQVMNQPLPYKYNWSITAACALSITLDLSWVRQRQSKGATAAM